MLKLKTIKLSELRVNRSNDRHGDLADEAAGIEWLLSNRAAHMRNLTKDVVISGEVFEPPLVCREADVYTVYDGNRRTTVLKLLSNPKLAPDTKWEKFFADQRKLWNGAFPNQLQCQVEDDQERLDEILYRRHTGNQEGVGQSQWDQTAKRNFERRTGKHTSVDIAEEIENLLSTNGLLDQGTKIKRSNLNRLLSSEKFWNRLGIAVEEKSIVFTHQQDKVLSALSHIAQDLMNERVVLKDIWKNEDKVKYLNRLNRKGVLPTEEERLDQVVPPNPEGDSPKLNPRKTPTAKAKPRQTRKNLIRDIDLGIKANSSNRRALDIIAELQHDLEFGCHDNAIAVLFRVLIEISIEEYLVKNASIRIHSNDNLAKRFSKVNAHMFSQNIIDKKYHQALKKFEQSEPIFSAHTLNAYVHNPSFFPSEQHLKSMWDSVEEFVVSCLSR